jgi:CDP-diacylglycerol---glycerol-3-phosphate 3-phosphatidyltransferase
MGVPVIALSITGLGAIFGGYLVLAAFRLPGLLYWAIAAVTTLGCTLACVVRALLGQGYRYHDRLGTANKITLFRGILLCGVAGFATMPPPSGPLAWLPGCLFAAAVGVDVLDGAVARRKGETTRLGEVLDREFDALGTLVAALVAYRYGKVPLFYIGVGSIYYWFTLGLWLRRKRGRPVHDLPSSLFRRIAGAGQSVFLVMALLPLFEPAMTYWASWIFGLLVLVSFARDWQITTESAHAGFQRDRSRNIPGFPRRGIEIVHRAPDSVPCPDEK